MLLFAACCGAADLDEQMKTSDKLIAIDGTLQSINEELSDQRARIGELSAEVRSQSEDDEAFRRSLLNEIKALRRQNQSLVDSLFAGDGAPLAGGVSTVTPLRNYDMQTPDGKMFFGEDEYIYVREANATIEARIDTGAAVSSISADDITEFERAGRRWFRFFLRANDRELQLEAPFVRYSDIRQSSKETLTRRPVVSLNIKVGSYSTSSEFTLTDRGAMQYPLLIGRTLLQDIAVVDVSRRHIQERADPEGLLILNRDDYNELKKQGINPNAAFDERQQDAEAQIAYPAEGSSASLGTNPSQALPQVVENLKKQQENSSQ